MKKLKTIISAALILSLVAGCGSKKTETESTETTNAATTEVTTETVTEAETEDKVEEVASDLDTQLPEYVYTGDDNVKYVICSYICDELAKGYEVADVGIPYMIEVARDESNPDDIKVWGEYDYYTYNLEGDTLITEAGGSYPGCMHVKKTGEGAGYEVTRFDVVADGSDFDESAKEIFGEYYDDFTKAYSNDEAKEAARIDSLLEYTTSQQVKATKYQDYGWEPVDITLK